MTRFISSGGGAKRYTLRFAVDLPHSATFSVGPDAEGTALSFFGRRVELLKAPFGLMMVASDFGAESEARAFGDRLRVACQLLAVRRSVPLFASREPTPIFEPQGLVHGLDEAATKVDGVALEMSYTIIPEHQVVLSYGELRGNLTRLVPPDYFSEAFGEIEEKGVVDGLVFNDSLDTALNFWSVAHSSQREMVRIVNVVAALEVLAAGAGAKGTRERAVRELIQKELALILSQVSSLPRDFDVRLFCKGLFRRRNELVHTGGSNGTSLDLSSVAEEICKVLLIDGINVRYLLAARSSCDPLSPCTDLHAAAAR